MERVLSDPIALELSKMAKEAVPNEMCALVINTGTSFRVIPSENKSPTPKRAFQLDPVIYVKHYSRIEFIVHSHVGESSAPSEADKRASEDCGLPYLIVSTLEDDGMSCYRPTGLKVPYQGRPFTYTAMDCFALAVDYYRHELNKKDFDMVSMPHFGWWEENGTVAADILDRMGFKQIESRDMHRGDIILMQLQGKQPNHVAVYVGDGLILHHLLFQLSREETYSWFYRKVTVGIYRHVD